MVGALLVSFIGIRGKDSFPPSRGVMSAGIAVFLLLVAGTAAYAVASAREEQEHREEEQAHEEAEAAEEVAATEGEAPAEGGPPPQGEPAGGPATTLDVASPEDGSLVFEPHAPGGGSRNDHPRLRQPLAGAAQHLPAGRRGGGARARARTSPGGCGRDLGRAARRASTSTTATSPATATPAWRGPSPSSKAAADQGDGDGQPASPLSPVLDDRVLLGLASTARGRVGRAAGGPDGAGTG